MLPRKRSKNVDLPAAASGGASSLSIAADVKKAVEAIAVNPRAGKLTLLTRKLFNVLLHLAQQQGVDETVYRMSLSQICANASFDSNDTALIKEHLRKMNACQVEWNTGVKGNRRWGVTNLLSEVELIEDPKSGRCLVEWTYSPKIKGQLLEPETYTRLSLYFQSSLRSSAALALYEICCRYATSPSSLTMRVSWAWWRPVLTGIPDGDDDRAYMEYKYFKRDVVKPAVLEVSTVTDLDVELIEHKEGRRIVDIQFRVSRKSQTALPLADTNVLNMELVGRLMALGLSQNDIAAIYGSTEESTIKAALELTEKRMRSKGLPELTSAAAYFKDALRKGYAASKQIAAREVKAKESAPVAPKLSREDIRRQLHAKRLVEAREYFAELGEAEQAKVLAEWESEALPSLSNPIKRSYKTRALDTPLVATEFYTWMARTMWGEPSESDLLEFMLEHGGAGKK